MAAELNHLDYYRLPWNYADNGISWLEPTTKCNLKCKGCYRDTASLGHKTVEEVRNDLKVFKKLRKSDCMSIAGGDPLVYPHITEIVAIIKDMGWKPIINTNGLALDANMLRKLKDAGAFGFTFHIDTSQNRPGITASREVELNELRLKYARMLADVGGLSCSFNATISDRTVNEIPALADWAREHADIVHTMVFILFRSPELTGNFDFYANGKKIEIDTYKETEWGGERPLMAPDIVAKIQETDPMYEPAAYLNGTANPDSFKWLLANRIVVNGKTIGYASPRFVEIVQTVKHLFTGTYLAYGSPESMSCGRLSMLAGSLIDRRMRKNLARYLKHLISRPSDILKKAHLQSLMIIQPVNFEPDGRQDMCDSCPDITVHNGKLLWSCRLEEVKKYGAFVQTVPADTGSRQP